LNDFFYYNAAVLRNISARGDEHHFLPKRMQAFLHFKIFGNIYLAEKY